ncbi:MAG: aminotransferase class I/II-fold pyridoxal phosphate-dependent enzyme [Candidatus Micrarchaeota archaeon]
MLKIAARVDRANYAIRDQDVARKVKELKKEGRKTYELNIGDPGANLGEYGFRMPSHIKDEIIRLVGMGGQYDGYANEQGEKETREAVADYSRKIGIRDADAEKVVVGNGLSELLDYFFGCSVEKGRNVVLPRPDYPLYTARVNWYEGEARYYTMDPKDNWKPKVEEIEKSIDKNTVAVVLINPDNPTGAVFDEPELKAIIDAVEDKGKGEVAIISDEIYHLLRFDGKTHVPTASLTDSVPVITLDGFSKGFYAPGWRIGHALFSNFRDDSIFRAMVKVCSFRLSANNAVQHAYAKGVREREAHMEEYRTYLGWLKERAKFTSERLNSIDGISCNPPRGAFYALPKVEKMRWKTDKEFIMQLLGEEGVRVVPGSGFAMPPSEGYFRVVTLPSLEVQKQAYDHLEKFMQRHLKQK